MVSFFTALSAFIIFTTTQAQLLPEENEFYTLSAEDFKTRIDEGGWFDAIIDVRSASEFASGHIENATLIESLASFGTDDQVSTPADLAGCEYCNLVVYCQSGGRASQAIIILREAGFRGRLWNGQGTTQWTAAGYPLVDTDSMDPVCLGNEEKSEQCRLAYLAYTGGSTIVNVTDGDDPATGGLADESPTAAPLLATDSPPTTEPTTSASNASLAGSLTLVIAAFVVVSTL